MSTEPLKPRVIEAEERDVIRTAAPRLGPQIIATERTGRIVPAEPARTPAVPPAPRAKSRTISFGLAGLGVFFAAWIVVDAYWWIAAAFERSTLLGALAATAVAAGIAGAGAIVAREVRSLWRLRSVEAVRARLADDVVRPRDARAIIADILAVVPRERETQIAIEAFERQTQVHHTVAQQLQILSQTVMVP